jgi:peptidoglycan-associated lipoprotein
MKLSKFANLLAIGLTLAVAIAGCSKRPGELTRIPGTYTHLPEDNTNAPPLTSDLKPGETNLTSFPVVDPSVYEKYIAHPEILQADTIYFDFDSSVVKSSEKSKISAVVEYMKANPANAVRVAGHCDERGTEEYNRSLGERRALAAREELISQGANANRIPTETFGKDRPADPGHNEEAWKKNRRAEFIVLTPPPGQ